MTGKNRRIDFTYDAVGHKKSISYPNKTRMNYDYGTAYWMTKADGVYVKNGVEQLINKNVITQRDGVGNITQKEINTGVVSYVYDDKYRLTGYTNTNASPSSQSFTFDYRGNRLSLASTPGGTTGYTVGDNNMVTAAGSESLQYDGRGNVTGRGYTQYEWDYKNRLVKVDKEGVQEDLYYTYNNADRMLSRKKRNKKVTYFYNGNQLLCEKDEFGRLSKVFMNDSEGLLGFTKLNYKPNGEFSNYEPVYYLFNDQGSVTTLTNEVGRPIKHYLYDPYGNLTNTTTDPNNNFTFIGRYGGYKDWDSGLIQFQHRWYDSALGRWMSRDPIGICGGINIFEYVVNNVVNNVDFNGLGKNVDTFINCLSNCIVEYDPLNAVGKTVLTLAGGTFWKSWIGASGTLLGGNQPLTTIPSAIGGSSVRVVGRFFSGVWIAYGSYLFGLEAYCSIKCFLDIKN